MSETYYMPGTAPPRDDYRHNAVARTSPLSEYNASFRCCDVQVLFLGVGALGVGVLAASSLRHLDDMGVADLVQGDVDFLCPIPHSRSGINIIIKGSTFTIL